MTTRAFEEAGCRVSRQLLMQSLVNLVYGSLGRRRSLPHRRAIRDRRGLLGAALPIIPYVGPILGAGAPILIGLAPLARVDTSAFRLGLLLGLDKLFTNLVLETVLVCGAAGVSAGALLIRWPSGRGCGPIVDYSWPPTDGVPRRTWPICSGTRVSGDAHGGHSRTGAGRQLLSAGSWPEIKARRRISSPSSSGHKTRQRLRRNAAARAELRRARSRRGPPRC